MESIVREVKGIPDWVLRGYLEGMGGQVQPDGRIAGAGWQARLTVLEEQNASKLVFGRVRVELQGEAEMLKDAWRRFELKILRPGG